MIFIIKNVSYSAGFTLHALQMCALCFQTLEISENNYGTFSIHIILLQR